MGIGSFIRIAGESAIICMFISVILWIFERLNIIMVQIVSLNEVFFIGEASFIFFLIVFLSSLSWFGVKSLFGGK